MADEATLPGCPIDPSNGFCHKTKIFQSLRPRVPLPPPSQPLSIAQFCFSLLQSYSSSIGSTTVLIDASTGLHLSYSVFLDQIHSLAVALRSSTSLSKGHVAFILVPSSLQVPVLYFALLTLGVTISPANPLSSYSEIAHQVRLCKPVIAFAVSSTSDKLPSLPLGAILLDSPEFLSMISGSRTDTDQLKRVQVSQSDSAVILYSSGTTGQVKGVMLTHGNFIAGFFRLRGESDRNQNQPQPQPQPVSGFTLPLFHILGFFLLVRAVTMGETLVLMGRFDFESMLMAVEKYRVTYMPVSPPLVVALAKSDLVNKYDLSSLQMLGCGGAPLGKEVAKHFATKVPNVMLAQVVHRFHLWPQTKTANSMHTMMDHDLTLWLALHPFAVVPCACNSLFLPALLPYQPASIGSDTISHICNSPLLLVLLPYQPASTGSNTISHICNSPRLPVLLPYQSASTGSVTVSARVYQF